ncbi:hypothetical protein PV350_42485 [Streptomyces sp. PA03-6a]|nr:hypothetical protein [Streptomyces sp. PA03-6a]
MAARLFQSGAELQRTGVDIFVLEWAARLESERSAVARFAHKWVSAENTARWTDRDWGTLSAARHDEAVMFDVVKYFARTYNHRLFHDYDRALEAARQSYLYGRTPGMSSEHFEMLQAAKAARRYGQRLPSEAFRSLDEDLRANRESYVPAAVAHLIWVSRDLRGLGVDVFALQWAGRSVGEKAAVEALVRKTLSGGLFGRSESTAGWTDRDWGVVAAAHSLDKAPNPKPENWSQGALVVATIREVASEHARSGSGAAGGRSSGSRRGPIVGMALVDDQAQKRQVLEELRDGFEKGSAEYEQVLTALAFVDPAASPVSGEGTAAAGAAVFGDAGRGSDTGSVEGGSDAPARTHGARRSASPKPMSVAPVAVSSSSTTAGAVAGTGTRTEPARQESVPAVLRAKGSGDLPPAPAPGRESNGPHTTPGQRDAADTDDEATVFGDADADDEVADDVVTLVDGGDAVADKKGVGRDKSALPGAEPSHGKHAKVRAWLTGQSRHADLQKAALRDPDSRFPADVTANPAAIPAAAVLQWAGLPESELADVKELVGRWLSGSVSTAGWTRRDWADVVEAARYEGEAATAATIKRLVAARNPDAFARYQGALANVRELGNPSLAASRLFQADEELLTGMGVDVFGLEWAALEATEQVDVETLVGKWLFRPEIIENWFDRDWGVIAVARSVSEGVVAATIKHVMAGQNGDFARYQEALANVRRDAARVVDVAGQVRGVVQAGRSLMSRGMDVFGLEWAAMPGSERTAVQEAVRGVRARRWPVARPISTAGWTDREWGAVAVASHISEALAAGTAELLVIGPQVPSRSPAGSARSSDLGRGPFVGMVMVDNEAMKREVVEAYVAGLGPGTREELGQSLRSVLTSFGSPAVSGSMQAGRDHGGSTRTDDDKLVGSSHGNSVDGTTLTGGTGARSRVAAASPASVPQTSSPRSTVTAIGTPAGAAVTDRASALSPAGERAQGTGGVGNRAESVGPELATAAGMLPFSESAAVPDAGARTESDGTRTTPWETATSSPTLASSGVPRPTVSRAPVVSAPPAGRPPRDLGAVTNDVNLILSKAWKHGLVDWYVVEQRHYELPEHIKTRNDRVVAEAIAGKILTGGQSLGVPGGSERRKEILKSNKRPSPYERTPLSTGLGSRPESAFSGSHSRSDSARSDPGAKLMENLEKPME